MDVDRLRRCASRCIAVVAVAMAAGCANKPATLPVQVVPADCGHPVDTLLVLLPGSYDEAAQFIDEGFVGAVHDARIAADVALVGASVPFYRDGDIVVRLDADVVGPAKARGIRHLWFAGISIGGLGSLIYANEGAGAVDGLLVIAPYLGERTIFAEVAASGGLAHWSPPGVIPRDDHDRLIWQWLKTLTDPAGAARPPLVLGYGVDDRFAAGERLLADALPRDRVFTASGGHDWPAWRDVWPRMLAAAPLPRCGPTGGPAR
jgi:hypothetical protein